MKAKVFMVTQWPRHPNSEAGVHSAALIFAESEEQARSALDDRQWFFDVSNTQHYGWGPPQFEEIGEIETSEVLPIMMDPDGFHPPTNETLEASEA